MHKAFFKTRGVRCNICGYNNKYKVKWREIYLKVPGMQGQEF